MTGWLRRYGFGLILLALFLGSVAAYADAKQTVCGYDADQHGQPYDPVECRAEFWDGFWENQQSEMAQLLVQFLGMVAFARWITYRAEEQTDRLEAKVDRLLGGQQ